MVGEITHTGNCGDRFDEHCLHAVKHRGFAHRATMTATTHREIRHAFTIVTDGRILANNTDEGPVAHSRGEALVWEISPRTEQAPTALITFD